MPQSFLFVRSQDRILGSSSSFKVQLPNAYKSITAVSLVSAELPYSTYNIDSIYTTGVTFTYNATSLSLVIPAGFYTIADIVAWLLATLQSSLSAALVTAVTYSTVSGRITIAYSGTSAFSVASNGTGMLGRIIGCDPLGLTTYGGSGTLVLPCLASLVTVNTIFMRVGELPSLMVSSNGQHATFRIQMGSAPGSVVMHNAASSVYNNNAYSSAVPTISALTVALFSQDGQPIDLHSVEWSFTLLIQSA